MQQDKGTGENADYLFPEIEDEEFEAKMSQIIKDLIEQHKQEETDEE
jgi:hypothetical protein